MNIHLRFMYSGVRASDSLPSCKLVIYYCYLLMCGYLGWLSLVIFLLNKDNNLIKLTQKQEGNCYGQCLFLDWQLI